MTQNAILGRLLGKNIQQIYEEFRNHGDGYIRDENGTTCNGAMKIYVCDTDPYGFTVVINYENYHISIEYSSPEPRVDGSLADPPDLFAGGFVEIGGRSYGDEDVNLLDTNPTLNDYILGLVPQ